MMSVLASYLPHAVNPRLDLLGHVAPVPLAAVDAVAAAAEDVRPAQTRAPRPPEKEVN